MSAPWVITLAPPKWMPLYVLANEGSAWLPVLPALTSYTEVLTGKEIE